MVAFLDSDNRWLPDKLATQLALLQGHESELVAVACGWMEEGRAASRRMPIASADLADFASGCWFCPGTTVVLPRGVFDVVGPFDPTLRRLEDVDWFLRFALAGGRLEVAPMTGAVVSVGGRGRREQVSAACAHILRRHEEDLEPALRRNLLAYLDLERAAAARNDGHLLAMAGYVARSFAARPRRQLPMRRWWDRDRAS